MSTATGLLGLGERTCVREVSAGGGRTQPGAAWRSAAQSSGCSSRQRSAAASALADSLARPSLSGSGARLRPGAPLPLRLGGLRRRILLVDRGLALAQAQRGRVGARRAPLETGLLVSGVHLDLPFGVILPRGYRRAAVAATCPGLYSARRSRRWRNW